VIIELSLQREPPSGAEIAPPVTPAASGQALQRPLAPAAAERMPSLAASPLDFASRCIAADTPSRRNRRVSLPAKAPLALATNPRGAVVLVAKRLRDASRGGPRSSRCN
jgi:hypothetical protein